MPKDEKRSLPEAKPTPSHPQLLAGFSQVLLLTFQHDSPAGKKDLAEWDTGVGPCGPVLIVQTEQERLDEGVAVTESVGEDIGDSRIY